MATGEIALVKKIEHPTDEEVNDVLNRVTSYETNKFLKKKELHSCAN